MQIYVGGRVEYRPPDVNGKPTVETLSAFLFPVTADFSGIRFHCSAIVAICALSVGRAAALVICRKAAGEESPGSMETRCRVTPGGVTPGKCHRKQTAPSSVPLRNETAGMTG